MHSRFLPLALSVGLGLAWLPALPGSAEDKVGPEQIRKLIAQLGSENFGQRKQASAALDAIGEPALEALRKATTSEDAEIRSRAQELVQQIEKRTESTRLLAARRVHLVYKETPLTEAVADFQKKSGYTIRLLDPEGKLKDRTITLDTGATTFWRAFGLFAESAGLTEATPQEAMMALPPAGPAPPVAMPGARAVSSQSVLAGQLFLKDGKFEKRPTDDRSAIRIRALPPPNRFGQAPPDEVLLALEVAPEPRLQWRSHQSVRVDKALDDQDQPLNQVTPLPNPGGAVGGAAPAAPRAAAMPAVGWGSAHPLVPIQLKKGEKAARSLKELTGVISAQLFTDPRPIVTADNLLKAAGKTFKGTEGGSISILEVKTDEQKMTTIRFDFEAPSDVQAVNGPIPVPVIPVAPQKGGAVPPPARGVAPPLPPAPAVPAPVPRAQPAQPAPALPVLPAQQVLGGNRTMATPFTVQDDKGNSLSLRIAPLNIRVVQGLPGGGNQIIWRYTFYCQPQKDQGEPAKLVFHGRRSVAVDIPFTLKDVPLP
jgi:hypothetical protein